MIKIENLTVHGFEEAIRGMRNPMNSWDKSDSYYTHVEDVENPTVPLDSEFHVGEADKTLMMSLASGGPVHAKYRRMITVYMDITAPLYWWKEFDTYKVGTVRNSCSTMHKIHEKEFTIEDFSTEHLDRGYECAKCGNTPFSSFDILNLTIDALNYHREYYLSMKEQKVPGAAERAKDIWWQMIQLLPSSYNQRATVMLNYETLAGIYRWRKDHKLDEWQEFCKFCAEELPHSEIFTTEPVKDIDNVIFTNVMTPDEIKGVLGVEQQKRELEKFRDYIYKNTTTEIGLYIGNDEIPISHELKNVMNQHMHNHINAWFARYMKEQSRE